MARHRREVVEPEVLAEGTDSEEERGRRHEGEEDSEEEEELDDEVGLLQKSLKSTPGSEVIKLFSCSTQLSMKSKMLIKVI